jgi:hypothetical protein
VTELQSDFLCLRAADPNRRLLQSAGASPADTYSTATPAATSAGSSTVGLGTAAMGTLGMASTIGTAGSFLSTQGQGTRRLDPSKQTICRPQFHSPQFPQFLRRSVLVVESSVQGV